MSTYWVITSDFKNTAIADAFSNIEKIFMLQGELITKDKLSDVIRVNIDNRNFYVKRYYRAGRHYIKRFMRSRVRSEWHNLNLFKDLNIATADLVAYGEQKKLKAYKRGALITEEIPNTVDLVTLAESSSNLMSNKEWLYQIMKQIAAYTNKLHKICFVHNDLKWRNILVTTDDNPKAYFIDCPMGKKTKFLKRGIIKDIACLDKRGKMYLSKADRLRFYCYYNNIDKLIQTNKNQINRIINFFAGRE